MNHVFCTECGNKIEYAYSKPKFCSGCGNKCGGGAKIGEKAISKVESEQIEESLADDETAINELPEISRLEVETESYGNNVFSFESLVGVKDQNPKVRDRGSKTIEDFIDDKRRR